MWTRLRKQAGYTIGEIMVATAILGVVGLAGSTLIYVAADRQYSADRLNSRDFIVSELNHVLRDPRALRASLEKTDAATGQNRIACLKTVAGGARVPCSAMAAPAGLLAVRMDGDPDPLTTSNGKKCYQEKGATSATLTTCDLTHPIEVSVTFQIICVGQPSGGTSVRSSCSSNQASVVTKFTVTPHPDLPSGRRFRPIRGTSVMELKALYSLNDVTAGVVSQFDQVTKKDLTTLSRQYRKTCANTGEIMYGVDSSGNPLCRKIDSTCPPGQVFTGLKTVGSGASSTIQPVCVTITCGANQVFTGIDPATGASRCIPLSTDQCDAFSGPNPTGVFMVGYGPPDARPVCRKKTCLKGEIFGGFGPSGDAICLTTSFIPVCTPNGNGGGMSCSPTSAVPTPPPLNYYPNPTRNPGLPNPYLGVPYISQWDYTNHVPQQGWRNDYRDWGTNPSGLGGGSNSHGGLFRDLIGSGAVDNCDPDSDSANLKVRHNWYLVHRSVGGDCGPTPGAGDSCSGFGYRGTSLLSNTHYQCNYSRSPTNRYHPDTMNCARDCSWWEAGACTTDPVTFVTSCAPNIYHPRTCYDGACGNAYWACDGGEEWTSRGPFEYAKSMPDTAPGYEECTINTNYGGGTVTANCPTGHNGNGYWSSGLGETKQHNYWNWVVRASCNFKYNRPW